MWQIVLGLLDFGTVLWNRSPVCTVLLRGGLGNQLFQYTAAREVMMQFELSRLRLVFAGGQWPDSHPQLHDVVPVPKANCSTLAPARWQGLPVSGRWKRTLMQSSAKVCEVVFESGIQRQSSPFDPPTKIHRGDKALLDGYFQHRDWFQPSYQIVVDEILDQAPKILSDYKDSGLVSLKIRRSDYLNLGWNLSRTYYEDALDALQLRNCSVVLLSEDSESFRWIEPVLRSRSLRIAEVPTIHPNPHLNDFFAIAASTTAISANSSFSWWAAAVGGGLHSHQDVYYPSPWITNLWNLDHLPDMGLATWHAIDSNLGEGTNSTDRLTGDGDT